VVLYLLVVLYCLVKEKDKTIKIIKKASRVITSPSGQVIGDLQREDQRTRPQILNVTLSLIQSSQKEQKTQSGINEALPRKNPLPKRNIDVKQIQLERVLRVMDGK
jgi:hypothetical protein